MEFLTYQTIPLGHHIILSAIIFVIGVCGIFLNKRNILVFLMSIELMLVSVNINFVAFSVHLNDIVGQIFALFILTVAAAEISIGLAILIVYFRQKGSIDVQKIDIMKG